MKSPQPHQGPYCTHSQIIRFFDSTGLMVLEGHQYLRPDGSLGASGMFDPKRLLDGNTMLYTS